MAETFLRDERVVVAPALGSFAAPLARVDEARLKDDADARSRGMTSVARTFRPDALWVNRNDGPELEAFGRLYSESDDTGSESEARGVFEDRAAVYQATISNLCVTPGLPPLIASVSGPGSLLERTPASSRVEANDHQLEMAFRWAQEAIKRYATAGASAICVIEGRGWLEAGGDEAGWLRGISGMKRLIASFGIPALLLSDDLEATSLRESFDCAITSKTAEIATAPTQLGVAVDPEAIEAILDVPRDRWSDVRLITTIEEVQAASGTENVRRMITAMRTLATRIEGS